MLSYCRNHISIAHWKIKYLNFELSRSFGSCRDVVDLLISAHVSNYNTIDEVNILGIWNSPDTDTARHSFQFLFSVFTTSEKYSQVKNRTKNEEIRDSYRGEESCREIHPSDDGDVIVPR